MKRWKICFFGALVAENKKKTTIPFLSSDRHGGEEEENIGLAIAKRRNSPSNGAFYYTFICIHINGHSVHGIPRGTAVLPFSPPPAPPPPAPARFSAISIPRLMRQFYNLPPVCFPPLSFLAFTIRFFSSYLPTYRFFFFRFLFFLNSCEPNTKTRCVYRIYVYEYSSTIFLLFLFIDFLFSKLFHYWYVYSFQLCGDFSFFQY